MLWTWIIGALVFALLALAVYRIYKDKKRGKGCGCGKSCGSGCEGCTRDDV